MEFSRTRTVIVRRRSKGKASPSIPHGRRNSMFANEHPFPGPTSSSDRKGNSSTDDVSPTKDLRCGASGSSPTWLCVSDFSHCYPPPDPKEVPLTPEITASLSRSFSSGALPTANENKRHLPASSVEGPTSSPATSPPSSEKVTPVIGNNNNRIFDESTVSTLSTRDPSSSAEPPMKAYSNWRTPSSQSIEYETDSGDSHRMLNGIGLFPPTALPDTPMDQSEEDLAEVPQYLRKTSSYHASLLSGGRESDMCSVCSSNASSRRRRNRKTVGSSGMACSPPTRSIQEMFPSISETMILKRERVFAPKESNRTIGKGQFGEVLLGELYPPIEATDKLSIFSPNEGDLQVLIPTGEAAATDPAMDRRTATGEAEESLPFHQQRYTPSSKIFYHSGVSLNGSLLLSQSLSTNTLDFTASNRPSKRAESPGSPSYESLSHPQTRETSLACSVESFSSPTYEPFQPLQAVSMGSTAEKVLRQRGSLPESINGLRFVASNNPLLNDIGLDYDEPEMCGSPDHPAVRTVAPSQPTRVATDDSTLHQVQDDILDTPPRLMKAWSDEAGGLLGGHEDPSRSKFGSLIIERFDELDHVGKPAGHSPVSAGPSGTGSSTALAAKRFPSKTPSDSETTNRFPHTPLVSPLSGVRNFSSDMQDRRITPTSPTTPQGSPPNPWDVAAAKQLSSNNRHTGRFCASASPKPFPMLLPPVVFTPSIITADEEMMLGGSKDKQSQSSSTAVATHSGSGMMVHGGGGNHSAVVSIQPSFDSQEESGVAVSEDNDNNWAMEFGLPFRSVAVKCIFKIDLQKDLRLEALKNEVTMASQLRHKALVNWFGVAEDAIHIFLVMDLAEKGNLEQYVKRFGVSHAREIAPRFMADIILALEYLRDGSQHPFQPKKEVPEVAGGGVVGVVPVNQGDGGAVSDGVGENALATSVSNGVVLHRDLKPDNLLLTWDYHVKIADFGTSCFLGDVNANRFAGSASYASPEMIIETKACKYSDLWSAGCILHYMVTGRCPFEAKTPFLSMQSIKHFTSGSIDLSGEGLDDSTIDLITRLLQKEPCERIGSDETGGFEALKSHPFFAAIDWDCVLDASNITTINAEYNVSQLYRYLHAKEVIVYAALVVVLDDTRFTTPVLLVLTDEPRLFIANPQTNEHIIDLYWKRRVKVVAESAETFRLDVRGETMYRFRDVCHRADLWAERIAMLNHQRGKRKGGGGLEGSGAGGRFLSKRSKRGAKHCRRK